MKHLLIVTAVCALMLLAVIGVRNFDAHGAPRDEILAYEVSVEQSVEVTLHGGVERVSLTSWLVLPFDTPGDEPLPYALEVRLTSSDGTAVMSRRFDGVTQLPASSGETGGSEARLSDGVGYVSEPRTVEVDVAPLGSNAGRLRVSAAPGRYSRMLLRLAHSVERTEFEKRLLSRTMSTPERNNLTREHASLGFFDIPADVRTEAIGRWQQRLTAAGREGRDYLVRRLLIGPRAAAEVDPGRIGAGLESSPRERIALNLSGAVTLRVWSSESTRIQVDVVGREAPSSHAIGAQRWIDLTLEPEGLSTLVVFADPPSRLAFSAPSADSAHFFQTEPPRPSGRRLEILPEIVRQRAYRLDAAVPVTLGIAPAQSRIGLSLRSMREAAAAPLADGDAAPEAVRILWQDASGGELSASQVPVSFEASLFETVDDESVSEREIVQLHVPKGAARVLVFGNEHLLATPFVPEPGVDSIVFQPPFDQPPPEGLRWRNAPLDIKDWALIRPDDEPALRAAGRLRTLACQVRLEPDTSRGAPMAPRTLEPRGEAASRPVFVPTTYSPKYPFPDNAWVLLDAQRKTRPVSVAPAGELSILYLADAERLGQSWSLLSGGEAIHVGTLAFRSGARRLELPAGSVELGVEGLGAGGLLLAQAAPRGGGAIVKRQTFHALAPGEQLDFDFRLAPGELASVVVTVATEGGNRTLQLSHSVDRGRMSGRADHFQHRTSDYERQHRLRTGELGQALIWSEPFQARAETLPDRLGRISIPLGDDLPPGPHRLTLRHPKGTAAALSRYWVRAVLVGRVLAPF